jgi:tRNA(Arg) A34 adenosine deaminase TadA
MTILNSGLINKMKLIGMASPNDFKHVAAVVRGTSILSMGDNCLRGRSPCTCNGKSTRCSLHAETNAIRKAASNRSIKNNTSVDLVVIRVSSTGIIGQSKPCYQCMHQISKARFRISKIYYSTASGDIACENINQLLRTSIVHIGFALREKLGMISGDIPVEDAFQNRLLLQLLFTKY